MKYRRFYIRERQLKDGTRSLMLCSTHNGKTQSVAMGLYLEPGQSKTVNDNNKQKMMQARRIVAKAEMEQSARIFDLPRISESQLLHETWSAYEATYRKKDLASVKAMGKWLARFCGEDYVTLLLRDISPEWVMELYAYLDDSLKGGTPAAYFKKFKAFLAHQVRQGVLQKNPALSIHASTTNALTKEILTIAELQQLATAPCAQHHVKLAFLFACNTGLRWCDIKGLQWKDYDARQDILHFVQHKVEGKSSYEVMHQPLNHNAMIILESIRHDRRSRITPESPIFALPTYRTTLRHLRLWMEAAGIAKHITFHCARHSFITHLILLDTNIAMVAQLAGHSSTRHTERYIHLADKERAQAINRLPSYSLS